MERIDDLQWNGLKLIQDTDMFCFGTDAVELANFVTGSPGSRVCDLGCGSGIIPVLIAGKRGMRVTGVEIQQKAAALAVRNAEMNGLSDRVEIVCARMQDYAAASENVGGFDIVTCNPPYRKTGSGMKQESECIAIARHEIAVTLDEVAFCASRLLGSGGKFYTVCHIERLAEMMRLCGEKKLEPKILQILSPNAAKPPHLFLLKCIKDAATGLTVLPERAVIGSV